MKILDRIGGVWSTLNALTYIGIGLLISGYWARSYAKLAEYDTPGSALAGIVALGEMVLWVAFLAIVGALMCLLPALLTEGIAAVLSIKNWVSGATTATRVWQIVGSLISMGTFGIGAWFFVSVFANNGFLGKVCGALAFMLMGIKLSLPIISLIFARKVPE